MTGIFKTVLDMSITGAYIIAAVIILRFAMKKLPKRYSYALWIIPGIRLLCPFSLSSAVSMFNLIKPMVTENRMTYIPDNTVYFPAESTSDITVITNGNAVTGNIGGIGTVTPENIAPAVEKAADPIQTILPICAAVWAAGAAAMLLYTVISYIGVYKRLKGAENTRDNIYISGNICTPFVYGIFKPKIYLPSDVPEDEEAFILAHERVHIKRGDHIVKLAAAAALSIHWFNPFVWAAYKLMTADMELSCDETAVTGFDGDVRKSYAETLLNMSARQNNIHLGGILSFGESNIKTRIKSVLSAKKPKTAAAAAAFAVIAVSSVCLLTNAEETDKNSNEEFPISDKYTVTGQTAFLKENIEKNGGIVDNISVPQAVGNFHLKYPESGDRTIALADYTSSDGEKISEWFVIGYDENGEPAVIDNFKNEQHSFAGTVSEIFDDYTFTVIPDEGTAERELSETVTVRGVYPVPYTLPEKSGERVTIIYNGEFDYNEERLPPLYVLSVNVISDSGDVSYPTREEAIKAKLKETEQRENIISVKLMGITKNESADLRELYKGTDYAAEMGWTDVYMNSFESAAVICSIDYDERVTGRADGLTFLSFVTAEKDGGYIVVDELSENLSGNMYSVRELAIPLGHLNTEHGGVDLNGGSAEYVTVSFKCPVSWRSEGVSLEINGRKTLECGAAWYADEGFSADSMKTDNVLGREVTVYEEKYGNDGVYEYMLHKSVPDFYSENGMYESYDYIVKRGIYMTCISFPVSEYFSAADRERVLKTLDIVPYEYENTDSINFGARYDIGSNTLNVFINNNGKRSFNAELYNILYRYENGGWVTVEYTGEDTEEPISVETVQPNNSYGYNIVMTDYNITAGSYRLKIRGRYDGMGPVNDLYCDFTVPERSEYSKQLAAQPEYKREIYHKMLNSIDYYDYAKGKITDSDGIITFETDLVYGIFSGNIYGREISGSAAEPVIEEFNGHFEITEYRTKSDCPPIDDADRITTEPDGNRGTYYRGSPTNLDGAADTLIFPQALAMGYLQYFGEWDVTGEETLFGRHCTVIEGTCDNSYGRARRADRFRFSVDTETGILMDYKAFSNSTVVEFARIDEIVLK